MLVPVGQAARSPALAPLDCREPLLGRGGLAPTNTLRGWP